MTGETTEPGWSIGLRRQKNVSDNPMGTRVRILNLATYFILILHKLLIIYERIRLLFFIVETKNQIKSIHLQFIVWNFINFDLLQIFH